LLPIELPAPERPLVQITRRSAGRAAPEELADQTLDAVQCSAAALALTARELVQRSPVPVRVAWQYLLLNVHLLVPAVRACTDKAQAVQTISKLLEQARAPGALETVALALSDCDDNTLWQNLLFADAVVRDLGLKTSRLRTYGVPAEAFGALMFDATDRAGSLRRWYEAHARWYAPFEAAHPHVLRNWLLNNLAVHDYPAVGLPALELHTLGFLMRLTLFETLLVGRAALRREAFGLADAVAVAHALARHVEHDLGYRGGTLMGEAALQPAAAEPVA
jgi:hypothetical protein